MGFKEGLERELGAKVDRDLGVKLASRTLSSWLAYRLYRRLGAAPWQALGIVTVGNQLLGVARAIKGEPKDDVISFTPPGAMDWSSLADSRGALFGGQRASTDAGETPGTFTMTGPLGTTPPLAYNAGTNAIADQARKVGLYVSPEGWESIRTEWPVS